MLNVTYYAHVLVFNSLALEAPLTQEAETEELLQTSCSEEIFLDLEAGSFFTCSSLAELLLFWLVDSDFWFSGGQGEGGPCLSIKSWFKKISSSRIPMHIVCIT